MRHLPGHASTTFLAVSASILKPEIKFKAERVQARALSRMDEG